ncbi:LLM class flavin-dependent oxidoreductase [Pseudomonas sp. MLB6B]
MAKQLLLNAFNMNCIGHINHGLWTHPRDTSTQYKTLAYWTDLAKLLERGLFDGLFIADIVGTYDVYGNSVDVPLKESIQLPVNDPLLLVSAMAAVTRHLGFGLTANLTYEAPYLFARRLSTLDHLSGGRVGWNIVTGYLDSAAQAMGLESQPEHDRRYDQADEYLQVLYKLLEGSWADDAVVNDRARRVYAEPSRVRKVRHQGEFYKVEGYHLCEPSPQRTPVLFQAGTSARGLAFAGNHAECVFIGGRDKAATRAQVDKVRAAAQAAGRDPHAVKLFLGITVIVAPTQAQAEAKHAEYLRYASPEAGVAHFAASTGIDFATYALDDPITAGNGNAIQSATRQLQEDAWTRRRLLEQHALGGRYLTLVGDPDQVAEQLIGWIDDTGLDGFNLTRTVTPESFEDFIDLVVPQLQRRGRYKTAYAEGTLREKLFHSDHPHLPAGHPGAAYRHTSAPTGAPHHA